jgi:hypothetical protein
MLIGPVKINQDSDSKFESTVASARGVLKERARKLVISHSTQIVCEDSVINSVIRRFSTTDAAGALCNVQAFGQDTATRAHG